VPVFIHIFALSAKENDLSGEGNYQGGGSIMEEHVRGGKWPGGCPILVRRGMGLADDCFRPTKHWSPAGSIRSRSRRAA